MLTSQMISAIEKGYPITRFAQTIPKVQSKIVSWKTDGNGMIGLSLGEAGSQLAHGDSLICIQEHLVYLYGDYDFKILIPQNTLTVSMAMYNFKVGKSCQEFVLNNRTIPEEAFFSYQMLSKHCQATFYNENGIQYLAGICYYVQLRSSKLTSYIDRNAMHSVVRSSDQWPLMNRWDTWRFKEYRIYGRDCKTAGKRVAVWFEEGKDPMHTEYNYRTKKYELKSCEECKEEAKTYNFVPVIKKVEEENKPAPVVTKKEDTPAPTVTDTVTENKLDNETKETATVTQVVEKLEKLKVEEPEKKKELTKERDEDDSDEEGWERITEY